MGLASLFGKLKSAPSPQNRLEEGIQSMEKDLLRVAPHLRPAEVEMLAGLLRRYRIYYGEDLGGGRLTFHYQPDGEGRYFYLDVMPDAVFAISFWPKIPLSRYHGSFPTEGKTKDNIHLLATRQNLEEAFVEANRIVQAFPVVPPPKER